MDFVESSKRSRIKLDCPQDSSFSEIVPDTSDVNKAVEQVLRELFFSSGKSLIRIEINRTLIFLEHKNSSYLDIWGRKYRTGKNSMFLNRVVTLGKIGANLWQEDFTTFSSLMSSLIKCWLEMVQQDKQTNPNYKW